MTDNTSIGVVLHPDPDLSQPYFIETLAGLRGVFGDRLRINPPSADAWILLGPTPAQVARVRGIPAAIVNGEALDMPGFDVDNVAAARQVTRHLLSLGRRRIAFIAGRAEAVNAQERERGYREALAEAGIAVDPHLIGRGSFDRKLGRKAAEAFFEYEPDAIFAANDHMALGALEALAERGRRVPQDVAVAGFDDIPEAAVVGLTTARQGLAQMAEAAAEALAEWLALGRAPFVGTRRLTAELIVRASTGLPA